MANKRKTRSIVKSTVVRTNNIPSSKTYPHSSTFLDQTDYNEVKGKIINFREIDRAKQEIEEFRIQTASTEEDMGPRKDDPSMDWQEKYLDKLDRDISDMKSSLQAHEDRITRTIENAMTEIRDRDNQRHQDISNTRSEFMESISNIRSDLQETKRWIIGLVISTGVGIAGMIITIIFALWQLVVFIWENVPQN